MYSTIKLLKFNYSCKSVSLYRNKSLIAKHHHMIKRLFFIAILITTTFSTLLLSAQEKPRILISTDLGYGNGNGESSDEDDQQSMVHYLLYADIVDTEGVISSPPYGRVGAIHEVYDAYEKDLSNLSTWGDYPSRAKLNNVTKQGALNSSAPGAGKGTSGSNFIIEQAKKNDARPLYILVWGSITDVAQALYDDPSIKSKIRVYSIGSWNTTKDPESRDYIYNNHTDLWWIENNSTFIGMFKGGNQSGDLGNGTFIDSHIAGHGNLGVFYKNLSRKTIQEGDSPSFLYMISNLVASLSSPSNPTSDSWGGKFVKNNHGPNYWTDDKNSSVQEGVWGWPSPSGTPAYGAKTVNKWRTDYLRDFQYRIDRVLSKKQSDEPQKIESFTLINSDTKQPIVGFNPIAEGAEINLSNLPTKNINIRANLNPTIVGSVILTLDGNNATENISPYDFYGNGSGNLSVGQHSISATPYTLSQGNGEKGTALTINFSVVDNDQPKDEEPKPTSQEVSSFSLMNMVTDQAIAGYESITEGAVIDLNNLPTSKLNLQANLNPTIVGSVKMTLNGATVTENIAPYAFYGDGSSNLSVGQHSISATPYTLSQGNGEKGTALTINFSVVNNDTPKDEEPKPTSQEVVSFSLMNMVSGQVIVGYDPITEGTIIDLNSLPTEKLNLQANLNQTVVGSVKITLDGTTITENIAPYAFYGNGSGSLSIGQHTLSATPYTLGQGGGDQGVALEITFSVINGSTPPTPPTPPTPQPDVQIVESFSLMNMITGQAIEGYDPIADGAEIVLSDLPTTAKLNIQANLNQTVVGSVIFKLDGTKKTENYAPYAYYGDNYGTFSIGEHTVTATPYTEILGGGTEGASLSISFSIVENAKTAAFSSKPSEKYIVYPNPNKGNFNVKFEDKDAVVKSIIIHDMFGLKVFQREYNNQLDEERFSLPRLKSGLYKISIQAGSEVTFKTLLVEY